MINLLSGGVDLWIFERDLVWISRLSYRLRILSWLSILIQVMRCWYYIVRCTLIWRKNCSHWFHLETNGRFIPLLLARFDIWLVGLLRLLGFELLILLLFLLLEMGFPMRWFFIALEKLLRLDLLVISEGSSFQSWGPAKSTYCLNDSSLESEFDSWDLLFLWKLLARVSGRNPLFSFHMNLPYLSLINLSRGKISKSWKRPAVWWSLPLKAIMRTTLFIFKCIGFKLVGVAIPQFRRL